jgi:hypothetical protein
LTQRSPSSSRPQCWPSQRKKVSQRAPGVLMPLPSSVIVPSNVPAFTVLPSVNRIADGTPVADAGTSMVVPSVSISTSGSLRLTGSPTRLNHRPIDTLTHASTCALDEGTVLIQVKLVSDIGHYRANTGSGCVVSAPQAFRGRRTRTSTEISEGTGPTDEATGHRNRLPDRAVMPFMDRGFVTLQQHESCFDRAQ